MAITVLGAGLAIGAGGQTPPSAENRPREVKPPREPADAHTRLAVVFGVAVLPWTNYTCQTAVTLPGGRMLGYSGRDAAPGISLFAAPALTLPGPLRRFTIGTELAAGGLYTLGNAVTPSGAAAPFSTGNLQQTLRLQHSFGEGWRTFLSPYIEHDIASFRDNKLRLGYQFATQNGEYSGLFPPNPAGLAVAAYDVRLNYRAHLIRFSWSNFLYTDDYGRRGPSRERRTGLLRQMGICAGTHATIEVFFTIGPIWDL